MASIILASASPRRSELLTQIGVSFLVHAVNMDETPWDNELPLAYVQRLAAEKSLLAQQQSHSTLPILAADTSVIINNTILGKPKHKEDALAMLHQLSGQRHHVYTSVSLRSTCEHWQLVSQTEVNFRELTLSEMNHYWDTGEPCDKAGAYAIQGLGSVFVTSIRGSFSGVVGLPLFETAQLLKNAGVEVIHD